MFMRNTFKMAVQPTGGDVSSLSGMAEAPHKMIEKTTHALLITVGIPDTFWCFAIQYAVFLIMNTEHSVTPSLYQFSTSLVEITPLLHPRLSSGGPK